MASYKWARANNACEHLRFEATEGNSGREWEKWADAVSKVYLRHRVLALPDVSCKCVYFCVPRTTYIKKFIHSSIKMIVFIIKFHCLCFCVPQKQN